MHKFSKIQLNTNFLKTSQAFFPKNNNNKSFYLMKTDQIDCRESWPLRAFVEGEPKYQEKKNRKSINYKCKTNLDVQGCS